MLNMNQTGCRMGGVAFAAGEDLSLKAGYLVKLNAGKDLVLPTTDQDFAPYVVVHGADQGYLCGAVPVSSAMNIRVKLVGTCDAGELLVANGDGRVKAYSSGSTARAVGTAEETGLDGQLVLVRPLAYGVTGPAGADGAPGISGAPGANGMDAGMLRIPRSLVTGGAALGASDIGLVLFLVAVEGVPVWATTRPNLPSAGALLEAVSDDADPVLTLRVFMIVGERYYAWIPASLVDGTPGVGGWIDAYELGDGRYRLGCEYVGHFGGYAIQVLSPYGHVYFGQVVQNV
jgi:hypothetical protein